MYKIILLLLLTSFYGCASTPYIPYIRGGECIDRAIEIRQALKDQGYEARIILGIRGKKEGHAWIEYKDKETNEWITVRNY